mmetsp:Transcript_20282/g.22977  ORF Transcript_20282/g.22977 Transcript_20282/m.22977 type:complete len:168 (+) Transcript_20282:2-505(+)
MEKTLVITPDLLGPNLESTIEKKLIESVEGEVSGKHGYIISILTIAPGWKKSGKIKDTSGDVLFTLSYRALLFKPYKNEVLLAVVHRVEPDGIYCLVGPMEIFLSQKQLPAEFSFDDSAGVNAYISEDRRDEIKPNTDLRVKIIGLSLETDRMSVVGVINEDYLGIV